MAKQESSMRILKIILEAVAEHDNMLNETALSKTHFESRPAEELRKERL